MSKMSAELEKRLDANKHEVIEALEYAYKWLEAIRKGGMPGLQALVDAMPDIDKGTNYLEQVINSIEKG